MIVVKSNYSYQEVVFLNYYYCECFCLVNFGLISCIGKMIYLVLYGFVVFSDYLVGFVYIQQCYVHIYSNSYTIFLLMICL